MDNAAVDGVVVDGTTHTPATAATNWNAQIGSGQEWVDIQAPVCGNMYSKAA